MKYKYCQACHVKYSLTHEFCLCGNKLVLKQEVETVKPVEMPEAAPVFAESGKMSVKQKAAAFFESVKPKATLVLPPELDGWVLEDSKPLASNPFFDRFEIYKDDGQRAFLNRFKSDVLSNKETYEQLQQKGFVLHAGRLHNGTNSWDCEVVPAPTKQEKSLKAFLSNKHPSEDLALELLSTLKVVAEKMIESGVTPIAISPDFISKNGIDYYGACVSKNAILSTSGLGLLDSKYCAPEVLQSKALCNSVVYSFGQMISEALWGGPLALSSLQLDPPFASIKSDLLSTLLMGCLYQNPEERFTLLNLIEAINGEEIALPEWSNRFSDASKQVFRLGSINFMRVQDLFSYLSLHPDLWDELILDSNYQSFKAFVLETPHASTAALIFEKYQMPSLALIKLQQSICKAPHFYREYSLSDEHAEASVAALGQKVLNGDKEAKIHIEELFKALPEI